MRMRQLAKGQSVVFFIPEEIRMKILALTSKQMDAIIDVTDVITWAISETWADCRRSIPLWATQGRRFEEQYALWTRAQVEDGLELSQYQAAKFLEKEAQTLEDRYRPRITSEHSQFWGWNVDNENCRRIIDRCKKFDSLDVHSATLQEEQERELSPEIEQESQVERPPRMEPAVHSLHEDVRTLVMTGRLSKDSEAFLPAFKSLESTSAARLFDVSQFPQDLLVTVDFARTIEHSGTSNITDAYQRPVQWILTGRDSEHTNVVKHMVVVSPFEAEKLLPSVRKYRIVTLHLYVPRLNLGFLSMDSLDFYTSGRSFDPCSVPGRLILQLNLFAGQLYLKSFQQYKEMCNLLGLAWQAAEDGMLVNADGFITPEPGQDGFQESPVQFLNVLMTIIRRNCGSIDKTHVGRMLQGGLLEEIEF